MKPHALHISTCTYEKPEYIAGRAWHRERQRQRVWESWKDTEWENARSLITRVVFIAYEHSKCICLKIIFNGKCQQELFRVTETWWRLQRFRFAFRKMQRKWWDYLGINSEWYSCSGCRVDDEKQNRHKHSQHNQNNSSIEDVDCVFFSLSLL